MALGETRHSSLVIKYCALLQPFTVQYAARIHPQISRSREYIPPKDPYMSSSVTGAANTWYLQ
jgi:hypothetical protein